MNKIKVALNPSVVKLLVERFSIMKQRSPYWFFMREAKRMSKKIPPSKGAEMWRSLDPESKRLYFTMSQFDKLRFEEEKAGWLADVSSLLAKHGDSLDKLSENIPDTKIEQDDIDKLFDTYKKRYSKMIQADSTNKLYKKVLEKNDQINLKITSDELYSAIPSIVRPVLSKPRRPIPPFAIFARSKRDEIMVKASKDDRKRTFLQLAAEEWAKLSADEKKHYDEIYEEMLTDYEAAKTRFEIDTSQEHLIAASKERKAFKASIRKMLRQKSSVPIAIRGSFNFYKMENKGLSMKESSKMWRELPIEEKERYYKMVEEDRKRYFDEIKSCPIKGLSKLLKQAKSNDPEPV